MVDVGDSREGEGTPRGWAFGHKGRLDRCWEQVRMFHEESTLGCRNLRGASSSITCIVPLWQCGQRRKETAVRAS